MGHSLKLAGHEQDENWEGIRTAHVGGTTQQGSHRDFILKRTQDVRRVGQEVATGLCSLITTAPAPGVAPKVLPPCSENTGPLGGQD